MTDYTRTPNLGLYKPNYAMDVGQWGNHLNLNSDTIDVALSGAVNVRNYGAVGDGVTDDAPAFASWLAALANGGHGVIPHGTYVISSPLSQAFTSTVTIEGAGSGVTILYFNGVGDGLTLSLSPIVGAHVRGLTFIRDSAGATFANTGLTITTPADQAHRYGAISIEDIVFFGDTKFWLTQIHVFNCSVVSLEHIFGQMPNADGVTAQGVGIKVDGKSAGSYTVEVKLDDVEFVGGSVGLQIGDWVQGVYVAQCVFIGNDYGIRWSGVQANADLWLAVSNTHCNSGTRGIFSDQGQSPQILNTYHLHFGIPSLDGSYAAIETQIVGPALICNNSFYGSGSASTSTNEVAIDIEGGNNTIIYGNFISNMKNAGIYFNGTLNTIVTANVAGLPAGIPLVQYAGGSVSSTNKSYGNMLNGALTFSGPFVNAANDAAAASAGVPVDGMYRNGSALMVRVA